MGVPDSIQGLLLLGPKYAATVDLCESKLQGHPTLKSFCELSSLK